jgi:3'-phosphoadenosine 5'-phosphosulfate sulfotransferase (PAPS reductase)/FAD synthetase
MWQVVQSRRGETFTAHLLARDNGAWGIGIRRPDPTRGEVWEGIAVFPAEFAVEAERRLHDLDTDVDVEDLLREWSDPDGRETVDFITFVSDEARGGELHGPDEDLPELIVPADLVRPKRAVKKPRKKKVKAEAPPLPYMQRAFPRPDDAEEDDIKLLPLNQYDYIIVSFSGGKDSVACVLHLLELGVPPERIELWHQAVDGRPHHDPRMWDWPCTESYCEAFAAMFGMRLLYQWKEGGYLRELSRRDAPTAPTTFQLLDGREATVGGEGDPGTRLAFPAMAADLTTRWCSAYLKIDVAKKVFTNDPRFAGRSTLIITGERRQESSNRAGYAGATDYSSTKSRTVHQWRAVLSWFEQDVWEIMERFRVRPHPAYFLGWSRVSCLPCIFGNPDQWAAVGAVAPGLLNRMAALEDKFYIASQQIPNHPWSRENQQRRWDAAESLEGQRRTYEKREKNRAKKLGAAYVPEPFVPHEPVPFDPGRHLRPFDGYLREGESLREAAARGKSYVTSGMGAFLALAMSENYPASMVHLALDEPWVRPAGAYGHSGGPT